MKIRAIWVNSMECWEMAWMFHAEDEYTSDENSDLWPQKMAEAYAAHKVVRTITFEVPDAPVAALFDDVTVPGTVVAEEAAS